MPASLGTGARTRVRLRSSGPQARTPGPCAQRLERLGSRSTSPSNPTRPLCQLYKSPLKVWERD